MKSQTEANQAQYFVNPKPKNNIKVVRIFYVESTPEPVNVGF